MRRPSLTRYFAFCAICCASCEMRSCGKRPPPAQLGSPPEVQRDAGACSVELGSDRQATREEILALVLPAWRPADDTLQLRRPTQRDAEPGVELPYLVEPCRGEAVESRTPPIVGRLDRVPLDDGRELVQFPVGTREGLDEYTVGLRAMLVRHGESLHVVDVEEESSSSKELHPYRRARMAGTDVLLQSESTSPASEDVESGTFTSVVRLDGPGAKLVLVGWISESRASSDTFWGGEFNWQMTSAGIEPVEGAYVVNEHWTYEHRKTKKRSQRELVRRYTLAGGRLGADPPDDLDAWPETRMKGWTRAIDSK